MQPDLGYGTTAPLFVMSQRHGVPYEHVLRYADFLSHGRGGTNLPSLVQLPQDVRSHISEQVSQMTQMWDSADHAFSMGDLVFMGSQGWQRKSQGTEPPHA